MRTFINNLENNVTFKLIQRKRQESETFAYPISIIKELVEGNEDIKLPKGGVSTPYTLRVIYVSGKESLIPLDKKSYMRILTSVSEHNKEKQL